jgi:acetyl esterase/lipase
MRNLISASKWIGNVVTACALVITGTACGQDAAMKPVIAEDVSSIQAIAPVAGDGHMSRGYLRKPPGDGPFPAVVLIHGGLRQRPPETLRDQALGPHPSRLLESGYVVVVATYRSREDPRSQTPRSLDDVLAAVAYTQALPYVDSDSVVVNGCSGGGDLALRIAAATDLAAFVVEEPASLLLTDLVTAETFAAAGPDGENIDWIQTHRTEASGTAAFREKIVRMTSPVLIVHGDEPSQLNRFNAEVLVPELQAAGKDVQVVAYPGQHCLALAGGTPSASRAFRDIDAYIKERVPVQPTPIDPTVVDHVPLNEPLPREEVDVSSEALAAYVGSYRLPVGLPDFPPGVAPTMVVTLESGQLAVEVREGALGKVPFSAQSETFFFSPQYGWIMEFVRGEEGTVTDLLWNGALWAPRL